jgi:hypothetical protein
MAHFLIGLILLLLLDSPAEFFLRFQSIFNAFADESVGGGALDIVDVEASKVVLFLGRGVDTAGVVRMNDLLLGNCRIVAQSLEVLLVGGLKELLSLGNLPHLIGRLAILECAIRNIALLVEGVGAIVGGAVELSSHDNKIID